MKVLMSPLIAVSVLNQADLIKKLLTKKGFEVEYKGAIATKDARDPNVHGLLWFTLCAFPYIGNIATPYFNTDKPKAIYVTIEGVPSKSLILCSPVPKYQLIANSYFTKEMLEKVGLNVVDVVHHGIDWNHCQKLREESIGVRKKWDSEYGDRVKLLYVGRNDPRKGLDHLAKAMHIVDEKNEGRCVLLMVCEGEVNEMKDLSNVITIAGFGGLKYDQVLALIGACDYLIFPSMCEGFGLPVLEAMAMGKPSIHAWFPPLSEFSSKDFNFVFGYANETLVNNANVQYWLFHEYYPEDLADMINFAIDIYLNSRMEYDEYCSKAVEHAKKFDYKRVYGKLLHHLKIS
jgi:glycosyltransferase involved in cell wall biosynthesis